MKKKVLQVGAKRVEKTPVPKKTYKSKTPPTPKKPPTRKYKRKVRIPHFIIYLTQHIVYNLSFKFLRI